jgi:hypothetical protein
VISNAFSDNIFETKKVDSNGKPLKQQEYIEINDDFGNLSDNRKLNCLILQDKKLKIAWDMFVMLILVVTTMIVPYRLAFIDVEPI